jgi:hypothetical protein
VTQRAVLTPARDVSIASAEGGGSDRRDNNNQVVDSLPRVTSPSTSPPRPEELLADVLSPVAGDMEQMRANLKDVVGKRHPMLMAAAEQIFSAGEGGRTEA